MKVVVCILLCCLAAVKGAPGGNGKAKKEGQASNVFDPDLKYEWRRKLPSYSGELVVVPEGTQVDTNKQVMHMYAQNEGLRGTQFYRSESMHDFKKGLVAVRPVGADFCLLSTVKKSYDETLRELERRQNGAEPAAERRPVAATRPDRVSSSESKHLDEFCVGRSFVVVDDRPFDDIRFPPYYPPILCIWGPIYPYYPFAISAERQGGYGLFL